MSPPPHEQTHRLLPPLFLSATLKQSLRRPREQTCQGTRVIHEKNPAPPTKATETMLETMLCEGSGDNGNNHGALIRNQGCPRNRDVQAASESLHIC